MRELETLGAHRERTLRSARAGDPVSRDARDRVFGAFFRIISPVAFAATLSATRSTTLGMPSTLIAPFLPFLGISTARTGPGNTTPTTSDSTADRGSPRGPPQTARSSRRQWGRSALLLDLQPRIPQQSLGDDMRLALQPRLTHAAHPLRLTASMRLDDPASWLHPRCDTRVLHSYYKRVRQRARRRYSAPRGSAAWRSPSRCARQRSGVRARLHTFHRSASVGIMLPICRTPPGQ